MARSNEPFFWSMFSAGGVAAAFLLPIHLLLFGLLLPLGIVSISYDQLEPIVTHWVGKAYLLDLISLSLFHAAHRLRFALSDLGLKPFALPLAIFLYGSALVGSVVGAFIIFPL